MPWYPDILPTVPLTDMLIYGCSIHSTTGVDLIFKTDYSMRSKMENPFSLFNLLGAIR
jgi:hypothetical protein